MVMVSGHEEIFGGENILQMGSSQRPASCGGGEKGESVKDGAACPAPCPTGWERGKGGLPWGEQSWNCCPTS